MSLLFVLCVCRFFLLDVRKEVSFASIEVCFVKFEHVLVLFFIFYFRYLKMKCHGCRLSILSDSLLLVGHYTFHSICVKCGVCQKQLVEGEKCFADGDLVFCKKDFLNMYGERYVICDDVKFLLFLLYDFILGVLDAWVSLKRKSLCGR